MTWKFAPIVAMGLFALASLAGCGEAPEEVEATQTGGQAYPEDLPTGQLPPGISPVHYALDLVLVPEEQRLRGNVVIDIRVDVKTDHIFIHGEALDIESVALTDPLGGEIEVQYAQEGKDGEVRLSLSEEIDPGDYTLEFIYTAAFSSELDGIYKVTENGESYLTSQMQTISARRAFPGFDEPRFKVPFDLVVTAPKGDAAITNTPLLKSVAQDGGLTRHVFQTTKPLPTYLLAFAVGPYDVVEWEPIAAHGDRTKPIPLRAVVTKGNGGKTDYLLASTELIVHHFEDYFDAPYPYAKLDLIASPDYAFGAMENAATIVYREQYVLLDEETPDNTRSYAIRVHAHEIAHQWFGDLVTPRWWNDAWLNESFATWAENKPAHEFQPTWGFDTRMRDRGMSIMKKDRRPSVRSVRLPIDSNHDISSAFDGIGYSKGGAVIGMFENFIGKEKFRDGVRLHMQRYAHDVADFDNFVASLADGSGEPDLVEAFNTFILQPGVPVVDVRLTCDEDGARFTVAQDRYVPLGIQSKAQEQWQIPICYRSDLGEACVLLKEKTQSFEIGEACPSYFVPNAGAHGYYHWTLNEVALENLVAHFDELSPIEGVSVASNLKAWFDADLISFDGVVDLTRVMVASGNPMIAKTPVEIFKTASDRLVLQAQRDEFDRVFADLYGPLMDKVGLLPNTEMDLADPAGTRDLRYKLVEMMAFHLNDSEMRAELLAMGESIVGYGERAETPVPYNKDMREFGMAVALEEHGTPFAEAMFSLLEVSTVGTLRDDLIHALSMSNDANIRQTILDDVVLADWIRQNESRAVVKYLLENYEAQPDTWKWLTSEDHLDEIAHRLPNFARRGVAALGDEFCDPVSRDSYEAYMETKFHVLDGGPRVMAESIDIINQCIALKAAKRPEVATFLSAHPN